MSNANAEAVGEMVSSAEAITLNNVSVQAGAQTLLSDVSVTFPAGEIALVVGPSGVGKSILMRIIAALINSSEPGIHWTGDVQIGNKPAVAGSTGVVFQSFALFDEISPANNLDFARAFGGQHASPMTSNELLERLRVPKQVPTSRLSGGQRQRLAIARTLAYNPAAILYDEPTSGLDPETGKQVAELIREMHNEFKKTSLVVTHDYVSLLPIADRVFLLDPNVGKLVELPKEDWNRLAEILEPLANATTKRHDQVDERSTVGSVATWSGGLFVATTNFVLAMFAALISLLPIWRAPAWGLRFLGHFARMVFGPTAIIYLIASGMISGFVTTYFTFKFLPHSGFTQPLLVEDLLTVLGFAMYRIFVPVLSCVLIAARCGAAVTSDVGGRQYGNQIDAMKTFGARPMFYLLTPIVWSFLIGTPILCYAAFYAAKYTSLVTFVVTNPEYGPDFWQMHFNRGLLIPEQFSYRGFGWWISKLLCCGFGISVISYYQGCKAKYSTTDVSRSVTTTILWATLLSLFVHFVFALFEYEGVVPK